MKPETKIPVSFELDFISALEHLFLLMVVIGAAFSALALFLGVLIDGSLQTLKILPLFIIVLFPYLIFKAMYRASFFVDTVQKKLIFRRKFMGRIYNFETAGFDEILCLRIERINAKNGVAHFTLAAVITENTRYVLVRRLFVSEADLRPLMISAAKKIGCDYESEVYSPPFFEHITYLFKDLFWI
ncbi:MAG: hypothetical protein KKB51_03850 [Candidatus Riflebacteria bacterium]|nr:hypothetical protein [Candidatus Riflebacteria bacterium]